MRKVRFSAAVSLDGFIAGPRGEHDWIVMDPSINMREFFASIDTVLLGRKTFEAALKQGQEGSMPGISAIVCSRTLRAADHPGTVICTDAAAAVSDLKRAPGKDIWLMGGGALFRSLLESRHVDSIELAVVPVLLGDGIPLIPGPYAKLGLRLTSSRTLDSGLVVANYSP
jgi:dihydrofolate reductase